MNKKQFEEKINYLIQSSTDYVMQEALRLFESGAIDTNKFSNDYILPKIIFSAALKNTAKEFEPLTTNMEYQKDIKNLSHF